MKKKLFKGNMREMSMLIALVIIIILFSILTNGTLLRPMNISNLINQNAYVVILACGMLLCILTGGNIDLSVGSTVALVGAFAGKYTKLILLKRLRIRMPAHIFIIFSNQNIIRFKAIIIQKGLIHTNKTSVFIFPENTVLRCIDDAFE